MVKEFKFELYPGRTLHVFLFHDVSNQAALLNHLKSDSNTPELAFVNANAVRVCGGGLGVIVLDCGRVSAARGGHEGVGRQCEEQTHHEEYPFGVGIQLVGEH